MSRIRVVDGVAPASTTEPRDSSAPLALATSFSSCEYVHEPPLLQPPRTANRHTTRARAASREVACTIMWSTVACAERNRFKTHLPLLFLHAVPVHTGLEPLSCALLAPLLGRLLGVGRRAVHFGVGLITRTSGTLCIRAGTATVVAHSGHERRENIDGRGCIGNGGCHSRVGRCFTLALASAAGAVHWHRGHRSGPGTHPRLLAATNTLPFSNPRPSTCTQSLVSRLPGRGQAWARNLWVRGKSQIDLPLRSGPAAPGAASKCHRRACRHRRCQPRQQRGKATPAAGATDGSVALADVVPTLSSKRSTKLVYPSSQNQFEAPMMLERVRRTQPEHGRFHVGLRLCLACQFACFACQSSAEC